MSDEVICVICAKRIEPHGYRYANEDGKAVHGTCYEALILETTPNPDVPHAG